MPGLAEPAGHRAALPEWSGKRATLESLRSRLRCSRIPEGFSIGHARWIERREAALDFIGKQSDGALVAVRSDRADEDALQSSNAGHYRTCLHVDASDRHQVGAAVDAVFASYGHPRAAEEVFIQRQIAPVRDAAVASTHAVPDGAAYYVLSIAPGPRSDEVTRGSTDVDTWYLARDPVRREALPQRWRAYLDALIEVEAAFGALPCEVEMVADESGCVWLLQARPLLVPTHDERALTALRREAEAHLLQRFARSPPLLGMMPDWNPAELLGEHPRPLARTLFDRLITQRAWRLARAALGHARVDDETLLQIHAGRPYIDVRASFRSLLPAGLPAALAERVVDAYEGRLRAQPALHDKVEFEIAFTAAHSGIEKRIETRYPDLLDEHERAAFANALRRPTRAALDRSLARRLHQSFLRDLQSAPLQSRSLRCALGRLELRTGVRFAMAARMAFAIEALLRAAVEDGALDAHRLADFKRAAWSDVANPGHALDTGHVRAGTFELAVPPRREIEARAFEPIEAQAADAAPAPALSLDEAAHLERTLDELGSVLTPQDLIAHYRVLLQVRELGKFALARGVSLALDALEARARTFGIDREDAGWLPLDDLLDEAARATLLRQRIDEAAARHRLESALRMPLLLGDVHLDSVHCAPGQANYLGGGRCSGALAVIDARSRPDDVPLHAIVAIASADPGFDWIFLRRPAALLTAFGGPNSHMAIRCAEQGVPALLGVGLESFRRLAGAARMTIDFDTRTWSLA
jgi:hypothetical protein